MHSDGCGAFWKISRRQNVDKIKMAEMPMDNGIEYLFLFYP